MTDIMQLKHAVPLADMIGKQVHIYRNLHRERDTPGEYHYSVRQVSTGWVVGSARYLLLRDVKMHVQPAGRGRVLLESVKHVHAYLSGTVVAADADAIDAAPWYADALPITYNPYVDRTFVLRAGRVPVHHAAFALATPRGVLIMPSQEVHDCTLTGN